MSIFEQESTTCSSGFGATAAADLISWISKREQAGSSKRNFWFRRCKCEKIYGSQIGSAPSIGCVRADVWPIQKSSHLKKRTHSCAVANLCCDASRTEQFPLFRADRTSNESWPFVLAMRSSMFFEKDMSIRVKRFTRCTSGE